MKYSADGAVRDVIYLGLYTRYLVELDGGGDLVVVEQNLKTTRWMCSRPRGQKGASVVGQRTHQPRGRLEYADPALSTYLLSTPEACPVACCWPAAALHAGGVSWVVGRLADQ